MEKWRPKEREMKRDKPVFLAAAICNVSNCGFHRSVLGKQGLCKDEDKAKVSKRFKWRDG